MSNQQNYQDDKHVYNFGWVPVYETLATELRRYRDRQDELKDAFAVLNNGECIRTVVEPFSLFGSLNGYTANRINKL